MTDGVTTDPPGEVDIDTRAIASGGAILGIAMIAANGGNYLLNVFLGRWLTPAEFADANLMVTIMLLATAVAVSLQLIGARFTSVFETERSAGGDVDESIAGLRVWLERRALMGGAFLALVLAGGAEWWREFFNSADALPFLVLGLGMPFYFIQAVGRGELQGRLSFRSLAATFVVEMLVRVIAGTVLVALGLGVLGATIGLTASFVAVWAHVRFLVKRGQKSGTVASTIPADVVRSVTVYAGPIAILLAGQIIVNNGDVLVAKRFLDPETAGIYAAIALVGRAVFFLSWSVATTLFPVSAKQSAGGATTNTLLNRAIIVVAALGVCFVIGARVAGGFVLGRVFGPEYGDISGPLAWYAFATSMFAIANLIASHHLAGDRVRESVVLVLGGLLQTLLLFFGRGSIEGLIIAQVVAMALLLLAVAGSHGLATRRSSSTPLPTPLEVST